jgi:hypothetical protein
MLILDEDPLLVFYSTEGIWLLAWTMCVNGNLFMHEYVIMWMYHSRPFCTSSPKAIVVQGLHIIRNYYLVHNLLFGSCRIAFFPNRLCMVWCVSDLLFPDFYTAVILYQFICWYVWVFLVVIKLSSISFHS